MGNLNLNKENQWESRSRKRPRTARKASGSAPVKYAETRYSAAEVSINARIADG